MARILLISDDPNLGEALKLAFDQEGHEAHWVYSAATGGSTLVNKAFDLVVIDLDRSDGAGLAYTRLSRKNYPLMPVFLIAAAADEAGIVAGCEIGAIDYMRRPFAARDLVARVRVALSIRNAKAFRSVEYGEISVQPEQRIVRVGEALIELNRRQFDILCHLIEKAESVVTREALISSLAKGEEMFDRTIDSHVSFLRSRLRKAGVREVQINSVYGLGYRMEKKQ